MSMIVQPKHRVHSTALELPLWVILRPMRWRRWWRRKARVIAKRKERSTAQQFWFGEETRDSGNWAVDYGRQGAAAPALGGIVSKTLSNWNDTL
jgi:hypothetical protein